LKTAVHRYHTVHRLDRVLLSTSWMGTTVHRLDGTTVHRFDGVLLSTSLMGTAVHMMD
jgi:hypothetical protein